MPSRTRPMNILTLSRRAALSLAGALGVSALAPAAAVLQDDPELPLDEAFAGLSLAGAKLTVKPRCPVGTIDCFGELDVICWQAEDGRCGYIFPNRDAMRRSEAARIVADIQTAVDRRPQGRLGG